MVAMYYLMVNYGNFNAVETLEFKKFKCIFGFEPLLCYLCPKQL